MPDIRKQTGLPRYDPGRFTTPGSYSVNPTGDEAFAAALSGLMGLGAQGAMGFGPVAAGRILYSPQEFSPEFMNSTLRMVPAPLRQYLVRHPLKVPVTAVKGLKNLGETRYELPPNFGASIAVRPQSAANIFLNEYAHTGQYMSGGARGINERFPGLQYTYRGLLNLFKRGYLPSEWNSELLPSYLEGPGQLAQVREPRIFEQALKTWFPPLPPLGGP